MAEKKDPCRFTVMFNRADPNHLRVVEVLNQQKHRKAQFIVNAVLHYLCCPEMSVIQAPAPVDKQAILEIVAQYLSEHVQGGFSKQPEINAPHTGCLWSAEGCLPAHARSIMLDNADTLLDEDGLAAIADTMSSFLKKERL